MSERSAVQTPLLRYAEAIGWTYVPPIASERQRGGPTGVLYEAVLTDALVRLNPGVVTPERAAQVVRTLRLLPATIEGNREALAWLRGERSVYVDEDNQERTVRLVAFDDLGANAFHVTDEWRQEGPAYANRADAVFLVNGLPVVVAEFKAAEKPNGLAEAVKQLRRYHAETPEMVGHAQLVEASEMFNLLYGATWGLSRGRLLNWRDEGPEGDYETRVKSFFDRARILDLVRRAVLFREQDGAGLVKLVLRQHQMRAVDRVLERVRDPHKRRGLVWHTQGSGKTLTMITVAAGLLRTLVHGERPTVLMLVDRLDLEEQLWKNLEASGLHSYARANSKSELERLLRQDTRGLIVAMIHKFDGLDADLNRHASIVALVDEAHRTTGGTLGNYLMAALPNATYIGFTGTPIDRLSKGQGTFKTFGIDDPRGFLDKYSIADSIKDGTTVELHYSLAPNDLRVDREVLETEFLSLAEAEGVADVEELNAILDRAVTLREAMKSRDRIEKIAAFVAKDFRERVEPLGFKAFLVAVDREACALYKAALDQHLPPGYSRVVISPAQNDGPELKQHYLDRNAEKKVRDDFRSPVEQPKILIVTEKLLTGFDAPILYTLYLDKPMRDHVLLQTIARVNRPYEDAEGTAKPNGVVVDFVGIFERLESALAFDDDEVASVIQNLDVLRRLFETQMNEQAPAHLAHAQGARAGASDKDKERSVAAYADPEARQAFVRFWRSLSTLYDILSPDAFLRPFLDRYEALGRLYVLVRRAYAPSVYVDDDLTAKTRALLHERTDLGDLSLPGAVHVLDAATLEQLRRDDTGDTAKLLNLRKVLTGGDSTDGDEADAVLLSIGERAEGVMAAYEDRQLTTRQALDKFLDLADEAVHADEERMQLGLSPDAYAVLVRLRPDVPDLVPALAESLAALHAKYPSAHWDDAQRTALRAETIKALLLILKPTDAVGAANRVLSLWKA